MRASQRPATIGRGRGVHGGQNAVRLVATQQHTARGICRRTSHPLYPRMTRIFLTLASLSIILLVAAMVMGLSMGDLYERPMPSRETLHWATLHRLTGVAAALAVVFVESVVVTYFIGTSRWCKEVVETYQLDQSAVLASNQLKRRTFPWALAGMLGVVVVIALGGAADPASLQPNTKAWVNWHLIGAFSGIGLVAWTYLVAWNNILANSAIITGLVAEVARLRQDRGWDAEAGSGTPPNAWRDGNLR
jgi:hypothetical protein